MRIRSRATRAIRAVAVILLGIVVGVVVFAPKLLIAVLVLYVTFGAFGLAAWMLSHFRRPSR